MTIIISPLFSSTGVDPCGTGEALSGKGKRAVGKRRVGKGKEGKWKAGVVSPVLTMNQRRCLNCGELVNFFIDHLNVFSH